MEPRKLLRATTWFNMVVRSSKGHTESGGGLKCLSGYEVDDDELLRIPLNE